MALNAVSKELRVEAIHSIFTHTTETEGWKSEQCQELFKEIARGLDIHIKEEALKLITDADFLKERAEKDPDYLARHYAQNALKNLQRKGEPVGLGKLE